MNNEETKTMPVLTLDPFGETEEPAALAETPKEMEVQQAVAAVEQAAQLTPEEQRVVDDFADKIQINNSTMVLQYGAGAQKKIADFSETALSNVKTKDLGEIGDMLTSIVTELKDFEEEEDKGFFGFFKRSSDKLSVMKAKYDKAEVNIDRICSALEKHQVQLLKDVAMLDKMYEMNKAYFKELSMYILAGKQKLNQVRTGELPALIEKATRSGLPEDTQAANDLATMCDRFEKKIHDLELTRTVSIQMAPQIRLIQNNDTLMTEKIQSTLVNTIPLWKSQMVLALGVTHSQQAAQAQREVTNMTNELLRRNAATLKMATVETAKESERGIIDIETLRTTNESLISTLDEVMRIQQEGRDRRRQAETELQRIENDLKQKMLSVIQ